MAKATARMGEAELAQRVLHTGKEKPNRVHDDQTKRIEAMPRARELFGRELSETILRVNATALVAMVDVLAVACDWFNACR